MIDRVGMVLIALLVIVIGAVVFVAIPAEYRRGGQADAIAQTQGCENLGRARDLPSVYFLDCGGEIRMIRVR